MRTKTTFSIPKMDCPSEEGIIRLALEPVEGVEHLIFDLPGRSLAILHTGDAAPLLERLEPLGFGAVQVSTEAATSRDQPVPTDPAAEAMVLWQLLAINGGMFVVELLLGLWAQSTGLLADSADMLADAMVYGLTLYAVGRSVSAQRSAARGSGWLQLALAVGIFFEVARRAVYGSEPVELAMIGVATLALAANLACVALLSKHREGGVHLKASWIFTTNDALANVGVILAGLLVMATGSALPDLIVGAAVGALVLIGAIRILRL